MRADADSRRFVLRRTTAAAHERLETLIGPITCLATYGRYLRGTYAFRAPLEAAASRRSFAQSNALPNWRPTLIAAELEGDMRDLDLDEPAVAHFEPPAKDWHALGVLYVLEGSNLGARVLEKEAKKLGLDATFGARHLSAQTSANWPAFLALLESCDLDEFDDVAQSAVRTFEYSCSAMTEISARG